MNDQIFIPEIVEGLRMMNRENPVIFKRVASSFEHTSDDLMQKMRQAFATKDGETLAKSAHSLKGSSGSLGSRKVSDRCAQLQQDAQQENWAAVKQEIDILPAEIDEFRRALTHEIV